jgi:hypothetical protein
MLPAAETSGSAVAHVRRRSADDDLEGLELVAGGREARLGAGPGLRVGPDLLGGSGHPDLRRGGGEGGERERGEKQGSACLH